MTYSEDQEAVIRSPVHRLLVAAGPGTGKTFCMVERGLWLLSSGRVDSARRLLYLTFTVKAAGEVAERFEKAGRKGVQALTFHSWAFSLLRSYGHRVPFATGGVEWPFTVLDEVDQVELFREILAEYRWKVKPEALAEWANSGLQDRFRPVLPKGMDEGDLAVLLHEFTRRKADSNALDFRDLLVAAHSMLENDPAWEERVRGFYRAVFVDEAQDTDGVQWALVRRVLRPDTFTTAVGDEDQSLYTWRDADPALLMGHPVRVFGLPMGPPVVSLGRWKEPEEEPWEVLTLGENRRCAAGIVRGSAALIEAGATPRHKKDLRAARDEEGTLRLVKFGRDVDTEPEALPLLVETLHHQGSVAVLTRTNWQVAILASTLRGAGLPVFVAGERSGLLHEPEARVPLWFLRTMANPRDRWATSRVAYALSRATGEAVNQADVPVAIQRLRAPAERPRALLESIRTMPGVEGLLKLQVLPDGPGKVREAVEWLSRWCSMEHEVRAKMVTWALRWAERGGGLATFLFFSTIHAEGFHEGEEWTPEAVWLSTVHRAKGREWDGVVLYGAEAHQWPGKSNPEEDRRTFYVAATRARDRLVFTWRERVKVWGRWQDGHPTSWTAFFGFEPVGVEV